MPVMMKYYALPFWIHHHTASVPEVNGTSLARISLVNAVHLISQSPLSDWSRHLQSGARLLSCGGSVTSSSDSFLDTLTWDLYCFTWTRWFGFDQALVSGRGLAPELLKVKGEWFTIHAVRSLNPASVDVASEECVALWLNYDSDICHSIP